MVEQTPRDDMVAKILDAVPALTTDVALVKRDIHYLTKHAESQDAIQKENARKQDSIIERLDKLTVVNPEQFQRYQETVSTQLQAADEKYNKRFVNIEGYLNDAKPGISFANALVGRWITLFILLLVLAALFVGFSKVIPFAK
jgi:hypothetical protein